MGVGGGAPPRFPSPAAAHLEPLGQHEAFAVCAICSAVHIITQAASHLEELRDFINIRSPYFWTAQGNGPWEQGPCLISVYVPELAQCLVYSQYLCLREKIYRTVIKMLSFLSVSSFKKYLEQ